MVPIPSLPGAPKVLQKNAIVLNTEKTSAQLYTIYFVGSTNLIYNYIFQQGSLKQIHQKNNQDNSQIHELEMRNAIKLEGGGLP